MQEVAYERQISYQRHDNKILRTYVNVSYISGERKSLKYNSKMETICMLR